MGISVKTRKLLWGKAANRCSMCDCRRELIMDETETDDYSVVGEECHIVAREKDGPRGESTLSKEERDKYDNLVLMCSIHHKVIDDQPNTYTVELLKNIKLEHETWVRDNLNSKSDDLRIDLIYSSYIDEWCKRIEIDNWNIWTSFLLSNGQPSIDVKKFNELKKLQTWMFTRVMPKKYIELDDAFENFRRILKCFIEVFEEHSVNHYGMLETEKFYRIKEWNEERYNSLLMEFHFHVDLVQDLVVEMTRAANYICNQVRSFIMPDFRIHEGVLYFTTGPDMNLIFRDIKVSYSPDIKHGIPFGNLEKFKIDRINRDFCFGKGKDVNNSIELGVNYY
ncbi:hypothetical protein Q3D33_04705 [Enterococcus faecium]|nr:hypothetical protein [Enterococcus faecium]